MTTREFTTKLNELEQAIYEEKDPKTALIFLHKVLELAEVAAYYAMFSSSSPDKRIALANVRNEAYERAAQVNGFIQEMVREEGKK